MASEQAAPKTPVPVPGKPIFGYVPQLYDFYKTPDGEDCLEKTYYYTKYLFYTGSFFSVYEMVLVSKPATVRACIARYLHFAGPAAAVGLTFGSALCILGQLRKKNDSKNHFLAGVLAGTLYGAKYRSYYTGHVACLILGCSAAYFKFFKLNNWPIFEHRKKEHDSNVPDFDYSIKLFEDPGRPDRA